MHSEKVHAIVLSCFDYADTDKVLSLFTLEHGKLKVFARAAKKSVKRFGASLESTNCLEAVVVIRNDGLGRLDSAELSSCNSSIRERLESLALAMYACELVEILAPEGHPVPRLFRLLASFILYLDQQDGTRSDQRFFEINMLNILGYRPESCNLKPDILKECLRTGKFGKIRFSRQELIDAGRIIDPAIALHTQRHLQSLKFLNDVLEL